MANAGYIAMITRDWDIPQGAGTTNAFRPYQLVDDAPVYYDLTLSGWSARAQIRRKVGGDLWVELLSTAETGPRIELDADGWVTLVLPAATTEDAAWNSRKEGVYDVELLPPDDEPIRLAAGVVTVHPDVTRSTT